MKIVFLTDRQAYAFSWGGQLVSVGGFLLHSSWANAADAARRIGLRVLPTGRCVRPPRRRAA